MDLKDTRRTIGVERTYSLGDYKNIRLTDTISNLPESFVQDQDAVNKLRTLQYVLLEMEFIEYVKLGVRLKEFTTDNDKLKYLQELHDMTFKELKAIFANHEVAEDGTNYEQAVEAEDINQ